jgi:hypothetical protein
MKNDNPPLLMAVPRGDNSLSAQERDILYGQLRTVQRGCDVVIFPIPVDIFQLVGGKWEPLVGLQEPEYLDDNNILSPICEKHGDYEVTYWRYSRRVGDYWEHLDIPKPLRVPNISMSEHACFTCDSIAVFVDGKEVTEPCEHRKEAARRRAEMADKDEVVEGQIGQETGLVLTELVHIDDDNFDRFIDVAEGISELTTHDQHGKGYRYVDSGRRTHNGIRLFCLADDFKPKTWRDRAITEPLL